MGPSNMEDPFKRKRSEHGPPFENGYNRLRLSFFFGISKLPLHVHNLTNPLLFGTDSSVLSFRIASSSP